MAGESSMPREDNVPDAWEKFIFTDPLYVKLNTLRKKGWSNPAGDTFFQKRRELASDQSQRTRQNLYIMAQQIGWGLASMTGILNMESDTPWVLDLCMAPGGFSATVQNKIRASRIDAITLPSAAGGYLVMDRTLFHEILYQDMTMYISEMDIDDEISTKHPNYMKFDKSRPYTDHQYDLIFCGGSDIKKHEQGRDRDRDGSEANRLTLSQLVFALSRLKPGGSLVLLMHRVERWDTVCMLYIFNKFAKIQTFKPAKLYAIKSSFYLVAKNVDVEQDIAKQAVAYWKDLRKHYTFKEFTDIQHPSPTFLADDMHELPAVLIHGFGDRFLNIARPIWKIQADNLEHAWFTRER